MQRVTINQVNKHREICALRKNTCRESQEYFVLGTIMFLERYDFFGQQFVGECKAGFSCIVESSLSRSLRLNRFLRHWVADDTA